MREMKDSGIPWVGEIPKEWNIKPIRAAFREVTKKNNHGEVKTALKFTYGNIVRKSNFDADEDTYVADTVLNYTIVEPGTIILNGLNLNFDFITQRIGLVKETGVITSAYMAFEARESSKMLPEYSAYLFKSYDYCKALHNMGGGVRKILNFDEFKRQYVLIPPFFEQNAIVDFLDRKCGEINALAADIEKQIETLEDYKRSVITEAVTKGLNPTAEMKPSGIEFIGNIPKKWEIRRIKTIGTSRNGLTYSPTDLCDENEGTLVLRSSNIQNGKIEFNDNVFVSREIPSELMVREGDILICSRNGSVKLIGKNALIPSNMIATFGAFMMIFRTEYPKYMYYVLNSSIFVYYLGNFSTSTINQLTRFDFGNMKIPFCFDKDEQNAIVNFLDDKCAEIDGMIADKKSQLETIADYKKSFIYEYVTGKKEVPCA